jgi:hypothetical protein
VAGDGVRDLGPVVASDQVQAAVDASGRSGRGDDLAVVDEEHAGVEADLRKGRAEVVGQAPVCGGRELVEPPNGAEEVGRSAERDDSRTRVHGVERPADLLANGFLEGLFRGSEGRDDDHVSLRDQLDPVLHVHAEVGRGLDRSTVECARLHGVQGPAVGVAC